MYIFSGTHNEAKDFVELSFRLAKFASKELARPTLGAIKFDIDGQKVTLTACDGHALAKSTIESTDNDKGNKATVLLEAKGFVDALKAVGGKKIGMLIIEYDGKAATVSNGSTKVSVEPVEGEYPDVSRLEVKDNGRFKFAVNPNYLAQFGDALELEVDPNNPNAPIVVTTKNCDPVVSGLVMPIKN